VFRHALVSTEEELYKATRVNADLKEICLDGLSSAKATDSNTTKGQRGCAYALYNLWTWRSQVRARQEKQSRENIVDSIGSLHDKISLHASRSVKFSQDIKDCVQKKDKIRARRLLLQKKRNDNMLASLYAYRDELEGVLISLDESNEQQELVQSFKSANRVLKSHIVKGSGVDDFDELAGDLQEAQQDVQELQQAVTSHAAAQDGDIEDEMEELFGDDNVIVKSKPGEPPPSSALVLPLVPATVLDRIKGDVSPKQKGVLLVS
jgi:hypothetical protein